MSRMKYRSKSVRQQEQVQISKKEYNLSSTRMYNAGQLLQQIRRCGPVKDICPKCMQEMIGAKHECN